MRTTMRILLALVVIGAVGYYPLVRHSPAPQPEGFKIDLVGLRSLAASRAGQLPIRIQAEKVGEFEFAKAMVMAGASWQGTPIPIYSFRLDYPDHHILIDTAMADTSGVPSGMVRLFDEHAHGRMIQAMQTAQQIVITHEHFDHIGGLLAYPGLRDLLPRLRLTEEQLAHPDRMLPLLLDDEQFAGYEPLKYEGMYPLAPGVVLLKSPGHTPGSQMVYIHLAGGEEILLLGDVSWQMRNIHAVIERPLFMTAIIRENRQQVIDQMQALHDLAAREPQVHIVPGHDLTAMEALMNAGIIGRGFIGGLEP